MREHYRTKVHKRRLKALELEPYSHAEAELAAGKGCFKEAVKRKLETQPSKDELRAGKKVRLDVVEKTDKMDNEEVAA